MLRARVGPFIALAAVPLVLLAACDDDFQNDPNIEAWARSRSPPTMARASGTWR
jgi:hypothetical protein